MWLKKRVKEGAIIHAVDRHHFSAAIIKAAKLVEKRGSGYLTPVSGFLHGSSDSCVPLSFEKNSREKKFH